MQATQLVSHRSCTHSRCRTRLLRQLHALRRFAHAAKRKYHRHYAFSGDAVWHAPHQCRQTTLPPTRPVCLSARRFSTGATARGEGSRERAHRAWQQAHTKHVTTASQLLLRPPQPSDGVHSRSQIVQIPPAGGQDRGAAGSITRKAHWWEHGRRKRRQCGSIAGQEQRRCWGCHETSWQPNHHPIPQPCSCGDCSGGHNLLV